MHRTTYTYVSQKKDDEHIRKRLRELAQKKRKYGSPMLHILLRREGLVINHKRTERIYKEEGLSLRKKRRRKKTASESRVEMYRASKPNEKWAMDFVADSLYNGRRLRMLTVIDEYTRECPVIEVDTSLTGHRVTQVLDRVALNRGLPESIVVDNGPEFISKALDAWAYKRGIKLHFIRPGKPSDNCFIESFNGTFREECLNENWFLNIKDARNIVENWRVEYNRERPHTSIGKIPPEEFALQVAAPMGIPISSNKEQLML